MLQQILMSSPSDRTTPRSSEALRRTTGRDRHEWFDVLDAWGAGGRPYREIADYLKDQHGLSNWWAQKLIVEYEQARGLRDPGVRRDGTFEVGASKAIDATEEVVFDAFAQASTRERWLPGTAVDEIDRVSGRIRFRWTDGTSRVTVNLSTTTGGKTQVVIQHEKLAEAKAAETMKSFWRDRLTALKDVLES